MLEQVCQEDKKNELESENLKLISWGQCINCSMTKSKDDHGSGLVVGL